MRIYASLQKLQEDAENGDGNIVLWRRAEILVYVSLELTMQLSHRPSRWKDLDLISWLVLKVKLQALDF